MECLLNLLLCGLFLVGQWSVFSGPAGRSLFRCDTMSTVIAKCEREFFFRRHAVLIGGGGGGFIDTQTHLGAYPQNLVSPRISDTLF